jgi:hypothetical protein
MNIKHLIRISAAVLGLTLAGGALAQPQAGLLRVHK